MQIDTNQVSKRAQKTVLGSEMQSLCLQTKSDMLKQATLIWYDVMLEEPRKRLWKPMVLTTSIINLLEDGRAKI